MSNKAMIALAVGGVAAVGLLIARTYAKELRMSPEERRYRRRLHKNMVDPDDLQVVPLEAVINHGRDTADPWVVIHGVVYAIAPYLDEHPGGAEVLLNASYGGKGFEQATEDFDAVAHSDEAMQSMAKFVVGRLSN